MSGYHLHLLQSGDSLPILIKMNYLELSGKNR